MCQNNSLTNSLIERIRSASIPREPIPTEVQAHLAPLTDIRCILFDIYGTLFISGSGDVGVAAATHSADAFSQALAACNIGYLEKNKTIGSCGLELYFETIRAEQDLARAQGIAHPEVEIRQVWQRIFENLMAEKLVESVPTSETFSHVALAYECLVNPVWPMPGVIETMTHLRNAGMRLGIISNAQFFTPLLFSALLDSDAPSLGIDEALTIYSYVLREAKPSPRLFQQVLDTLRRLPGQRHAQRHFARAHCGMQNHSLCWRPALFAPAR